METRTVIVVVLVFLAGMVAGSTLNSYHHKQCLATLKDNSQAAAAIAAGKAKLLEEKESK